MTLIDTTEDAPFSLDRYLRERRARVEAALSLFLPLGQPLRLYEAMRYSLLGGGKRLRPILCLAACELEGGSIEIALPAACAIEMVHTMSLIHDDLPSMDDDDYRRGRLTNHKVYGEEIAILAGDALLAQAFTLIAEHTAAVPPGRVLSVIAELGRAVGASGLVAGQVVDLESEGSINIDIATLEYIHDHKTAALLEASVVSGAMLAGAPASSQERLRRYARRIGLAFQIMDDILDVTSTAELMGKRVNKDAEARKATYPGVIGLEESHRRAAALVADAKAELFCYGDRALPLVTLADYIIGRVT